MTHGTTQHDTDHHEDVRARTYDDEEEKDAQELSDARPNAIGVADAAEEVHAHSQSCNRYAVEQHKAADKEASESEREADDAGAQASQGESRMTVVESGNGDPNDSS
jgi:methylthioribose-1-phosphate isomerase